MKKIVALAALVSTLALPGPARGQRVVEEIVAIVNDEIVTLSDYRREFEIAVQQLKSQQLSSQDYNKYYEAIKKQLLDSIITDMLLMQQAKEKNINVKEQLKTIVENIKKENNIQSDEDLKRALAQQGMSYEAWTKQYEEMLLKQAVIFSEIESKIALTDAEVIDYYKKNQEEFRVPTEYKLRAVYLSGLEWHGEALENRKKEISDRLAAKESLADVAGELSDPPLREAKGDLGEVAETALDPELREPIMKLKVGEVSPWIKAKTGWYLIQLEEKKDSFVKPFEQVKAAIEEKIFNSRRQAKTEEFLKSLKARSYIKILNPNPLDF